MQNLTGVRLITNVLVICTCIMLLPSCDRSSSPEGRMTMKLESLQKEMLDSLRQQNKAILDSISSLRADIKELQQKR